MNNLIEIRIIRFFFDNPYKEFYLRELAKKIKLSPFAIKKYMDIFIREGLVLEERKANLRYFKANVNDLFFKQLKIAFSIRKIKQSGLISDILEKMANVSSIVLFGSVAKGEDDENSDIDIVVIGKEKDLSLSEIRKKLNKEINLHAFLWSEWNKQADTNKAFYFDVITYGIPLYGELPVIK